MLRTGKSDTLSTEGACHLCVVGRISVGTNGEFGILVAEVHELFEVAAQFGSLCGHLTGIDLTRGTVDGDVVTLLVHHAVDFHSLLLVVYVQSADARDAALAHTACHHSSVRGHTTASGENTLGSSHTGEVFGRSLDTYEHHFVAFLFPSLCVVGMEHDLSAAGTRRSGQTLSDDLSLREGHLVEYRVEELVELLGFAAHDGGLLVDHAFVEQVDGDFHHSGAGALAVTCLEEPQFALLHGELHILHIMVVVLQFVLDAVELGIDFGHSLFHGRILGHTLLLGDAGTFCPAL